MEYKLSIITPTYNSIQFIESCIQQVCAQQCKQAEHIIVDGGSTDGTLEIIQSYVNKYSHIRYISEPDKGQCDAMNKGIALAQADYIGFLNVDDGYMPYTLNRVVEILTRYSQPVFLSGNCKLIDSQGKTLYINRPKRLQAYHFYGGKEPYPINPAAYFYHKAIHAHPQVGLYNINNHYNMDYEFMLKACLYFPFIYCTEDWGYMLQHEDAKTSHDAENIEQRKKELLHKYSRNIPINIKIKAWVHFIKKLIVTH